MTKHELAIKLVKNLKLREWLGDFCYGDAMRAYRMAAMSDDQLVKYMMGYSKDFLITTVEEYEKGSGPSITEDRGGADFWNRYTGEN